MLPEISRRCVSCGAAVRAGARFCPQCGKGMSEGGGAVATPVESAASKPEPEPPREAAPKTRDLQAAAESEPPQGARDVEATMRDAESRGLGGVVGARADAPEPEARRAVPETGETASPYARAPVSYAQAASPREQAATPQPFGADDAAVSEASEASEERRGRVARVREGTRARVENTRARVERVKGDALVALEETPDDSGLRFVAVAVVLFVLFIAFLLLSVTVLR